LGLAVSSSKVKARYVSGASHPDANCPAPPLGIPAHGASGQPGMPGQPAASQPLGTPSQNAGSPELATVHDLAEGRELRKARFLKLMYAEVKAQVLGGAIQPELPEIAGVVDGVLERHERAIGQTVNIGQAQREKLAEAILGMLQKEGSRPAPAIQPLDIPGPGAASQLGIPSQRAASQGLGIPSLDAGLLELADNLYPVWRDAVRAGEITHAKEPCQKFIWKRTTQPGGKQVASAPETARVWDVWKARAVQDGILKPNPEYQPGNRKPEHLLAK